MREDLIGKCVQIVLWFCTVCRKRESEQRKGRNVSKAFRKEDCLWSSGFNNSSVVYNQIKCSLLL